MKACSAYRETTEFHAIYSLSGEEAQQALDTVRGTPVDAIVMLGTGMPTVGPIVRTVSIGAAPVISCMHCLAWRAIATMDGKPLEISRLMDLVHSGLVAARLQSIRDA